MWSWIPSWGNGTAAKKPTIATPAPRNTGDTMQMLQENAAALEARKIQAEFKVAELLEEAKEYHAKGDKARAMGAMKRKKVWETRVAQYEGQLMKMEQTSMAVDSTAVSADVAASLKDASEDMKQMLAQMSLDEIDEVANDIEENIGDAHEAAEALARPFGTVSFIDEDELDAEMSTWGGGGGQVEKMPSVPEMEEQINRKYDKPEPIKGTNYVPV